MFYAASYSGVFSASRDKTIKLWRRGNPHCVQEFLGHTLVVSAIHVNSGEIAFFSIFFILNTELNLLLVIWDCNATFFLHFKLL